MKRRFDKNLKNSEDFEIDDDKQDDTETPQRKTGTAFTGFHELHRKYVAHAVINYEIEKEMEEHGELGGIAFGPLHDDTGILITYKQNIENYLGIRHFCICECILINKARSASFISI